MIENLVKGARRVRRPEVRGTCRRMREQAELVEELIPHEVVEICQTHAAVKAVDEVPAIHNLTEEVAQIRPRHGCRS
eukprot:10088387-Prorocentrum_lima.AAC.1